MVMWRERQKCADLIT